VRLVKLLVDSKYLHQISLGNK